MKPLLGLPVRPLLVLLLCICACEVGLKVYGYKPFAAHPIEDNIVWLPTIPLYKDSLLGIRLQSGKFSVIYNNTHTIELNNNSEGFRVTGNNDSITSERTAGSINLLGDSYVQGCGVNDNQTFGWMLQNEFKNYKVKNYGVASVYNLVTKFIPEPKPKDIYIYYYTCEHNNRLIYRNMKLSDAMPLLKEKVGLVTLNSKLESTFHSFSYEGLALNSYSSLINFFEDLYLERLDNTLNLESKTNATQAIIYMSEYCKKRGATFIVASIRNDEEDKEFLEKLSSLGVETIDVSVDLQDKNYNMQPFDDHPNPRAHLEYYLKTSRVISQKI